MAATRRPIALAAAVATAAALGATAFALPALAAGSPAAAPAAAPKLELVDGKLEWGIKESFRKYIAGPIAQGEITVADGAQQADGNGVFTFTDGKGTYDTATHASDTAFKGSVRFEGHHGVLDVQLSDIKAGTGRETGTITADFSSKKTDGTVVTKDDAPIAALDMTAVKPGGGAGGEMVFADIPATLTADGAEAFAGFYAEGSALDPVTLSVKQAPKPPTVPPTENPTTPPVTPPPTGKPTEQPTARPTGPTEEPTGKPTPTASETAAPVSGPVVDGTLNWGVKESFRAYVVGNIAHGKIETSGGASADGGRYRFTKATGLLDADKNTLDAAFKGKVRFLGHETKGEYVLDLSISNLKVDIEGTSGKLLADVSAKDQATGKVSEFTALSFADLKVPAGALAAKDGIVTLKNVPATLTTDGAKAFGGFYKKGEELDALNVAVSIDKDAQLPGDSTGGSTGGSGATGGSGSTGGSTAGGSTTGGGTVGGSTGGSVGGSGALASTGSDVPTGALIAASGVVVAAGAGVVIAARRRRHVTA
ncbi:HtaA domain-containing protein [Streptomyces sp. TRM75563]|uniref:HtaA domain-containing protein n=1 Tax=Streptomyces sp. TRM75563 TaxID=2817418 RepID=UPI001F60FC34|nr:HtaA domain-containing protein [Streptomyces sp. TRM75563]MCI4040250.1 HtaA domain-containing protein [Streptomyces sp. TRM75563]